MIKLRLPIKGLTWSEKKFTTVQLPTDKAAWFDTIYISIYHGVPKGSMKGIVVTDEFMILLHIVKLERSLKTIIKTNSSLAHFYNAVIVEKNDNLGKLLIQLGAEPGVSNSRNRNVLSECIYYDNVELANKYIKLFPSIINSPEHDKTPLYYAILSKRDPIGWTKWCISAGAKVEQTHILSSLKWFCCTALKQLLIDSLGSTFTDTSIQTIIEFFVGRYPNSCIPTLQMLFNNMTKDGLTLAYTHLAYIATHNEIMNEMFIIIAKLLLQNGADQYGKKKEKTFIELVRRNIHSYQNIIEIITPENNRRINYIEKLVTIFPVYQQYQTITIVFQHILPTYVMLWIGDWLVKNELLEYQKVEIIEKMKVSINKVKAARINHPTLLNLLTN